MDGLPPEILSSILDVLEDNGFERLSPYSSISRTWQTTVEKRTFRNISVNINPHAIEKMHSVVVTGHVSRAHLVRTINVNLNVTPLDNNALTPGGSGQIDTAWWTAAMARMFTTIAKIVELVPNPTNLQLIFLTRARTSTVADWGLILRDAPTSIPELRRIVNVKWQHPIIWVSVAEFLALTEKLPDLEECSLDALDDFDWRRRRRMECREGLTYLPLTSTLADCDRIGYRSN